MFQPLGDPHFPPVSLRMDLANLFADLDLLAPAGVVLGTETKSALQTSLVLLKNAEKFKKVLFWGKILGITRDYYIAQGVADNEVKGKKSFYRCACERCRREFLIEKINSNIAGRRGGTSSRAALQYGLHHVGASAERAPRDHGLGEQDPQPLHWRPCARVRGQRDVHRARDRPARRGAASALMATPHYTRRAGHGDPLRGVAR